MIKDAEIRERAKANRREYMREYREKNRSKINAYARQWRREYKERTGEDYTHTCALRKAERQLKEERGIQ